MISINLPECAGDYFVGIIICPSNKDLTSATESPQPAREGALGGREVGPGWEAGHGAGWVA